MSFLFKGSQLSRPARVSLVGWPGKTSFLYFRKLGSCITTIPTIGFNVESFKGHETVDFEAWDIGGCGKILPLVTRYCEESEAIILFVGTRKLNSDMEYSVELAGELLRGHGLPSLPLVLFCVHRDLPPDEVHTEREVMERLAPLFSTLNDRPWVILFGSAVSPLGHDKVLQWLERQVLDRRRNGSTTRTPVVDTQLEAPAVSRFRDFVIPISESDALDDITFLQAVENYTLPSWDHKTHLRLAFLVLSKEGRQMAVSRIMSLVKDFIDNSPTTSRGKKFHVTMTYFWIQMIHYALATMPKPLEGISFDTLLAQKSWLLNSGLFQEYYSDELMFRNPESRLIFVLPDKKPLPNVLP